MNDNLTPEDRKYVEVYEQVSHEIQQKKDPEQIVRELMDVGYSERDAVQWVTAVASQLHTRMAQRSLFILIPGIIMLFSGMALRIASLYGILSIGFEPWLIFVGAVLSIWGLASWSKYKAAG